MTEAGAARDDGPVHDGLTGLPNGTYFREALDIEVARAHAEHAPLTLAYFDIDDFRGINDRSGHDVGDRVLSEVARRLREAAGSVGIVARDHGDHFGLILPGLTVEAAKRIAAGLRASLDENPLEEVGLVSFRARAAELGPADSPRDLWWRATLLRGGHDF